MAKCPKCGKENSKPDKKITNNVFEAEHYICNNCEASFSIGHYTKPAPQIA
jgi:transposase-like protein